MRQLSPESWEKDWWLEGEPGVYVRAKMWDAEGDQAVLDTPAGLQMEFDFDAPAPGRPRLAEHTIPPGPVRCRPRRRRSPDEPYLPARIFRAS